MLRTAARRNYKMTQFSNYKSEGIHGKYSNLKQRRTEEGETGLAQKDEGGKAEEAAGLCSGIEKAQGEEVGARAVEAVSGRE
ncbi:MAG: hypothetical protein ACLQLC_12525 [Candidatus Sulfotelmatobacter sp.]